MGNQNGMKLLRKCEGMNLNTDDTLKNVVSRCVFHGGKYLWHVKPVLENLRDKSIAEIAMITGYSEQFTAYIVYGLLRRAFWDQMDQVEFWTEAETKSILDEDEARAEQKRLRQELNAGKRGKRNNGL